MVYAADPSNTAGAQLQCALHQHRSDAHPVALAVFVNLLILPQTAETLPEHLIGTIRLDHVDLKTAGKHSLVFCLKHVPCGFLLVVESAGAGMHVWRTGLDHVDLKTAGARSLFSVSSGFPCLLAAFAALGLACM